MKCWELLESSRKPWPVDKLIIRCHALPGTDYIPIEVAHKITAVLRKRGYMGTLGYFAESHSKEHLLAVLKEADV